MAASSEPFSSCLRLISERAVRPVWVGSLNASRLTGWLAGLGGMEGKVRFCEGWEGGACEKGREKVKSYSWCMGKVYRVCVSMG